MLITLQDLEREPVRFDLELAPGAIDYGVEATQTSPLAVHGLADILREHRGPKEVILDIRARASWSGTFEAPCARCLEPVRHPLGGEFDLLFRPLGADAGPPDRSLGAPETEIGYYQGEGLVLEDVLREQVLLALPARSLCGTDCKGFCPRCGRNLNSESCTCDAAPADQRWTALSDLRSRLSQDPRPGKD
ncbi:MAG TPA: DUF177 domain-containing protein [Acidobacteriaceae bacterium]|jgi:uncharacterized protein|nr:DUF177 domain-containing protein [Acidobacteriaceae bacterium]